LDRRIEVCAAGREGADRLLDLLGGRVLREVAARPGLKGREERLVVRVGREDQHVRCRQRAADDAGRLGTVQLGHAAVHEHDVGRGVASELDGLVPVGGGADDLDVVDQADE
jgi:hypothetical protein